MPEDRKPCLTLKSVQAIPYEAGRSTKDAARLSPAVDVTELSSVSESGTVPSREE
jgi:hypothetical protein